MVRFRFRCLSAQSRRPIEAEIFLEDRSHGFTPLNAGGWLELHSERPGPQSWYALLWNSRIAHGESEGGDFEILIDETDLRAETAPSDFDLESRNPPPAPRD
jgi:hypothetical protein